MTTNTRVGLMSLMVVAIVDKTLGKRNGMTTRTVWCIPGGKLLRPSRYCPSLVLSSEGSKLLGMTVPSARIRDSSTPEENWRFLRVLRLTVALAATSCHSSCRLTRAVCVRRCFSSSMVGSSSPLKYRCRLWNVFHPATSRSASSMATMSMLARTSHHTLFVSGSSMSSQICFGVQMTMVPLASMLSMSLLSMKTVSALSAPTSERARAVVCICRSAVGTTTSMRTPCCGVLLDASSSRCTRGRR
mmetsp:Transcript_47972/g.126671  ORF Transcript_47972/g.126671 Transcript_47972/m.126671 type:complete len:245 (+) Transcript_47972:307-1041(+)